MGTDLTHRSQSFVKRPFRILRAPPRALPRRKHLSGHLTKPDSITVSVRPTCECQPVAILETRTRLTPGQSQRLRAAPGKFQQTTAGLGCGAGHGAGRQQIAGPERATVHRVVGELLRQCPVQVTEIGPGNPMRRRGLRSLQVAPPA